MADWNVTLTKVLATVVVVLWSALSWSIGYAMKQAKDPVLEQRVRSLETRIEERLLEINRRLDEISERVRE